MHVEVFRGEVYLLMAATLKLKRPINERMEGWMDGKISDHTSKVTC